MIEILDLSVIQMVESYPIVKSSIQTSPELGTNTGN